MDGGGTEEELCRLGEATVLLGSLELDGEGFNNHA